MEVSAEQDQTFGSIGCGDGRSGGNSQVSEKGEKERRKEVPGGKERDGRKGKDEEEVK